MILKWWLLKRGQRFSMETTGEALKNRFCQLAVLGRFVAKSSHGSIRIEHGVAKWVQSFEPLPLRHILAHFRCKQQGAVSRGRAVSRFRPPAWSATTADFAQKPPAWSAPCSRFASFARNRTLSRSKLAAWSATPRGPGTRSYGIPLLFL